MVYYLVMTAITTDTVRQLAVLSAISLSDDEAEALQADLTAILAYVDQLGELDTSGVEPTFQVTGLQNIWRDDTVSPDSAQGLVTLSADSYEHQFKVPKVL